MAGQTTQVGPGSVVQSAPPVIQTVPPQTPGATPIVPGPLGQGLPPVVQPAPMAVEPAVPSSSATIGHTAAISLPENASPPPLRGEPVPFPQALPAPTRERSEEHTSELQSLMRISYAVFCLTKQK